MLGEWLRALPADLWLGGFIVGPTVLIAVIGYLVHRGARGRRSWAAARDALVVAAVAQLLFTAYVLYSIVVSHSSVIAIIYIPFMGLPLSALAFLLGWALSLDIRSARPESLSADREPGGTRSAARPTSAIVVFIGLLSVAIGAAIAAEGLMYSEELERRAAAATSETAMRALAATWWARHDSYVLAALAKNEACPVDLLRELGGNPSSFVRIALASNARTPPDMLTQLGNDPRLWDSSVRRALVFNRATPPEVLRKLSGDPDVAVREGVAKHPSTPPDVLGRLTKDAYGKMREEANTRLNR